MNIERERGKCKYPLLFQPLKVNKIVLKNRIISAPLGSNTDKSLSGIGIGHTHKQIQSSICFCNNCFRAVA